MSNAETMARGFTPPLPQFLFEMSSRPLFDHLTISGLDLTREHPSIYQAVRSLDIARLDICHCMTQSAAQLGRFIISFPSLRTLNIRDWSLPPSGLQDAKVRHRTRYRFSIESLDICLVPNISALLNYAIGHKSFLAHLRELHLRWEYTDNDEHDLSSFRGVNDVFRHCWTSLESLTMTVGRSKSEDVLVNSANLCEWLME